MLAVLLHDASRPDGIEPRVADDHTGDARGDCRREGHVEQWAGGAAKVDTAAAQEQQRAHVREPGADPVGGTGARVAAVGAVLDIVKAPSTARMRAARSVSSERCTVFEPR